MVKVMEFSCQLYCFDKEKKAQKGAVLLTYSKPKKKVANLANQDECSENLL